MNTTPTKLLLVFLLFHTTIAVVMLFDRWRYTSSLLHVCCMPPECLSATMTPSLINWLSASTTVASTGWRLTWQLHHEKKGGLIAFSWIPRACMSKQRGGRRRRSLCELCVGSQVVSHDGAVWFERVLKIIRCSLWAEHFSCWKNSLKSSTLHQTATRSRPLPLGSALHSPFPSVTLLNVARCTLCREQNRTLDGFISGKAVALLAFVVPRAPPPLLGRMFIAVKWPPSHLSLQPATRRTLVEKNGPCLLSLMTNRLLLKH